MAISVRRGFCRACAAPRRIERGEPAHLAHAVLSLITLGLWIFVWILASLASVLSGWRCSACGDRASTRIPRKRAA